MSAFLITLFRFITELSAEALQIISTAFPLHLVFWRWVLSDEASDGFWYNKKGVYANGIMDNIDCDPDGGDVTLFFDFPSFEFYTAATTPKKKLVREGRMKHLSSRHRLYGKGLEPGAKNHLVYDFAIHSSKTS
jgi:hypothetical protein